jgi:hypothetical protein
MPKSFEILFFNLQERDIEREEVVGEKSRAEGHQRR